LRELDAFDQGALREAAAQKILVEQADEGTRFFSGAGELSRGPFI
jgi:hypothetical protein